MRKAVFPVAGYGTRMLPATKSIPKELLPIFDRPAIHYTVEEALKSGFDWIIFITAKGKEPIINYFDRETELENILRTKGEKELAELIRSISEMGEVLSVRQGIPKGLGHAVLKAKEIVGSEPFSVLLPDDFIISEKPVLSQMMEVFLKTGKAVVALEQVKRDRVSAYGIVKGKKIKEKTYKIDSLVEKPPIREAPSNLAVIGRYILTPEIFPVLEKTPPGRDKEIQLTDALNYLAKEGNLLGYRFEGKRFDIGSPEGFIRANIALAGKRGIEI